jgi:endoglucanase
MPKKARQSINRKILSELLPIPTAPFAEHLVIQYLERFCARRKAAQVTRDAAGNVLVRVRKGRRRVRRPVCITAHVDHPGFVAERMTARGRLRAYWRGGVPKEYFVGSRVCFYQADDAVRGRVRSVKLVDRNGQKRVDTAVIDVPRAVPRGAIGVWDLPDPVVRGSRLYARACDDLAGVAAMLCCIDELARSRAGCDAYFLFTRAEEVGFVGALAATRLKTIPAKCLVVSMETSSELPHARMGDGPILRVGDKLSAFTSAATAHCARVAEKLAGEDRRFRVQRRLMDGGSCESSVFCLRGYDATGICLALGNYHNTDKKRKKISPEYVDVKDFDNVVKWFVALAQATIPYTGRDDEFNKRLTGIERTYRPLLRKSRV